MLRRVVLLAVAGCGRIGFDGSAGAIADATADALDVDAWSEHVVIEVVNPAFDELLDVPVLVKLDASRIDYALAAADGRDLRFTGVAGALDHEIERWDPQGTSIIWVRIPVLAASPDRTPISMHYSNAAAQALPGATTWSTDHVAVYHFASGVLDSAAAGIHGNAIDATAPIDILGPALGLSSAAPSSYAVIPYNPAFAEVITLSGWIRNGIVTATQFEGLIAWPLANSAQNSPYIGLRGDQVFVETVDMGGAAPSRTLTPVPVGTWVHLVVVQAPTSVDIYIDGVPADSMPVPNGARRITQPIFLGADCDSCAPGALVPFSDFLDGAIDEVRLERVFRSPSWIQVQVASMRDELLAW